MDALPPPPPPPGDAPPARPKGKKKTRKDRVPAEQEAARLHQAVFAGFTLYLEHPGLSVQAVWETGRVSKDDNAPYIRDCVALSTFQSAASANGWVERRENHWREVRDRVAARLADDHVQRTLTDLATLGTAKEVALANILGDVARGIQPVKPKSLEGVLSALASVTKVEVELRKLVLQQTADAAAADAKAALNTATDRQLPSQAAALVADNDGFTDEEIEAMARAAALRNAYGATPAPTAPPAAPPVGDNGKTESDNETLARPVMEPL